MSPGIVIGEPYIITQERTYEEAGWGPCQFPDITATGSNRIEVTYHTELDSATAYGKECGHALSTDNGDHFSLVSGKETFGGISLPDGCRLRPKTIYAEKPENLTLPYKPDLSMRFWNSDISLYRASRFSDVFNSFYTERLFLDGTRQVESKPVIIEHALRYISEGVMPYNAIWRMRMSPDGRIWGLSYPFIEDPENGKPFLIPVFIISEDNGESFRYLGRILYRPVKDADPFYDKRDGFTEPDVAFMGDGSVLCLMRTMDKNGSGPLYASRSYDNGVTWSAPEVFDTLGVWPTLLRLGCGVTLASYGRPGIYLRVTDDSAGLQWDNPIAILPPEDEAKTCAYTGLAPIDNNHAMLVYSHFFYPDDKGVKRKTILSRKITVL